MIDVQPWDVWLCNLDI